MLCYTVFRTQWGYFAFAGADDAISRTFLPAPDRQTAQRGLLWALGPAAHDVRFDPGYLPDVQSQIVAYFEDASAVTDKELGLYMLGLKRQSPEEIGRVLHE